jgi:hypothetical protein
LRSDSTIAFLSDAPLLARLQHHEHVGLVEAHRIEAQLVGTGARDDALHLGHIAQDRLLHAQVDVGARVHADRRQRFELHDDVALVHRRHEGLARAEVRADRATTQHRDRHRGDDAAVRERALQQWRVDRERLAHEPRIAVSAGADQE